MCFSWVDITDSAFFFLSLIAFSLVIKKEAWGFILYHNRLLAIDLKI